MFFSDTVLIDTSSASSAVNQISTDLSSWVSVVLPFLIAVVGVFLVFWLVRFSIKLIRSFASSSDVTFTASNGVKYNLGSVSSI